MGRVTLKVSSVYSDLVQKRFPASFSIPFFTRTVVANGSLNLDVKVLKTPPTPSPLPTLPTPLTREGPWAPLKGIGK